MASSRESMTFIRANNRAGADGGMTVLFHAERGCPAAAQHGRWNK